MSNTFWIEKKMQQAKLFGRIRKATVLPMCPANQCDQTEKHNILKKSDFIWNFPTTKKSDFSKTNSCSGLLR